MWTAILLLQSCLTVPGDRILAGDLAPLVASLAGVHPATPLGYAPLPGLERRLTKKDLERALGPSISASPLPSSICIVRSVQPIDDEQIRLAMRKVLPEDAEIELVQRPRALVPPGVPQFAASGLRRTAQPGLYAWRGQWIPESGGRSLAIAAQVRIRLRRQVIVAAREIEPGAGLTPSDWVMEEREVALPLDPPLTEHYPLDGCKARRRIAAGQPLKRADLIPPEAVRAGQALTLVFDSGAARIAVEAQALTSGRLGDVILVKSPLSGKRLRARLAARGLGVAER